MQKSEAIENIRMSFKSELSVVFSRNELMHMSENERLELYLAYLLSLVKPREQRKFLESFIRKLETHLTTL